MGKCWYGKLTPRYGFDVKKKRLEPQKAHPTTEFTIVAWNRGHILLCLFVCLTPGPTACILIMCVWKVGERRKNFMNGPSFYYDILY